MMDEPLGALDAEFREHMSEELRALHDRMGATTVYVTHDQLEAMQMGDKIVVMNHGVVEQFGTPQEIYDHPATMFVADFIGSPSMNFLRFEGSFRPGDRAVTLGGVPIATPELQQEAARAQAGAGRAARACGADRRRRLSRADRGDGISRHDADRHAVHAARHDQGPHPLGSGRAGGRDGGADLHALAPCRCSTQAPAAPSAPPRMRGCIMAEVVLPGLSKSYGATQALNDVSMTIPDGAFVVLLGPTGAGKTTTLRLIAGLDQPDAGDIRIDGA